jgi:hypothetical protein
MARFPSYIPACPVAVGDYVVGQNFLGRVVMRTHEGYTIEVVSGANKGKRNSVAIPKEQFHKVYKKVYDLEAMRLLYE